MSDIDTSPAALRALAAKAGLTEPADRMAAPFWAAAARDALRALAAEKEAAIKPHDSNRAGIAQALAMARNDIRRAFDRDEITAEDYRRMNDELDRNAGIVRADPKPPMSAAEKEASDRVPGCEAPARVLAEWLGYAWDGLHDRDISNRYPDWVYDDIGGKNFQGGRPALRRVAQAMLAAATVKPDLTVGEEVTPLKAVAVMGVRPPLAQESSPIISTTVDLRTLAGAATPGPWQVVTYRTPFSITRHDGTTCSGEHVGRDIATVRHHPQSHAPYPIVTLGIGVTQETPVHFVFIRPEDADYLAAVSPEVVLALLDTIDALRASLAAAEKERDAQTTPLLWWKDHALKVETERDAAIARAEKAEADLKYVNEARALDLADHQTKIKEMAERIRKAEAERDAARWQPIETAPRDRTLIDLWAGERIANCAWNVPSKCWAERVGASFDGKHWAVVNNPTHWMPLPAAPANPEDPAHD